MAGCDVGEVTARPGLKRITGNGKVLSGLGLNNIPAPKN
jgi:hypothetical protein